MFPHMLLGTNSIEPQPLEYSVILWVFGFHGCIIWLGPWFDLTVAQGKKVALEGKDRRL